MKYPMLPGSMTLKALTVRVAPSRPVVHRPDMTIARAVMVHTTMVSRKTSIGPQTPCSDGVSTLAGEWTMAAVPRPASLEYIPLATPIFMVTKIEPMIPPVAAEGLNAALRIVPIADGT